MPTPASGAISFLNIKDNFYGLVNYDDFAWGTNLANLYNLNYYRGRGYSNGTLPSGAIAFNNFYNSTGNCQCACSTDSAPTCFPGDALVTLANGTKKRIDQILTGDVVDGGYGYKNTVQAYHVTAVGKSHIYIINGKHRTSVEHKHWTTDGWAAIDIYAATSLTALEVVVDNDGNKEKRSNTKLARTKTSQLKVGMTLVTESGLEQIEKIERDYSVTPDTLVYTLVTDGSHSHICNDYIVGAWARDIDFDYETWKPL